MKKKAQN
jgi:hypothetical protein